MAGSVSIACGITVINNVDTGRSGYPLLPAFYSLTKTNTIMTKPSEHFRDTIREYLEQRAGADALFAASCAKEHALRKATEEAYAKITHKSKSQPVSNAANAANQQSLF